MIENHDLLKSVVAKAIQDSQAYNWKKCGDETFAFLSIVHEKNNKLVRSNSVSQIGVVILKSA